MRLLIAAFAASAVLSPAFANETTSRCESYVAENGGDASGCSCLGDRAAKDQALADAIAMIDSPAALDAASEGTKEAIKACFPDAAA